MAKGCAYLGGDILIHKVYAGDLAERHMYLKKTAQERYPNLSEKEGAQSVANENLDRHRSW